MKLDNRALKQEAGRALSQATCDPKKLVLLHTGVTVLAGLVLTVISYLLQLRIDGTAGLGGIGTRSVLSTVQSMLTLAQVALLPFWQAGYLAVALAIARGEGADKNTLLSGFDRFGPFLRLFLLQGIIYGVIAMGSSYLSSFLYMLTPMGTQLMEQMVAIMGGTGEVALDETAMMQSVLPMMLLGAAVFLVAAAPTFYRMRLSRYVLMDGERSALRALAASAVMMKGCRLSLFRLDLSFWWYYLLQGLVSVVCYGDMLLGFMGITLPFPWEVGFFGFFVLYMLCQLGLDYWQKNRVEVTYGAAYELLRQPRQPKPQPTPQNLPWEER